MKRIFQRRARSPSASSSSESSPAAASTALSPRRAASASFKTFAAPIGAESSEIRASKDAVGNDTLHAKVAAFATSASAEERQQALGDLYDVLVVATQYLDGAGGHGKLLNGLDNNTLVSVTAQRLRSGFSRSLELFNADRLEGKVDATFSLATASQERDYVLQMLHILKVLVVKGDNAQALLLVGERIPSTFVKVVKALSDGDSDACGELVEVVLEVLAALVTSPEVVQELNETSTLHRIFHLAFREEKQQTAVVKVVESLVQGLQPSRWRSMVKHLYEGRCLLELIHNANGTGVLAKAVLVTALSLRRAHDAGLYDLHRQMHTERQRHKILALLIKLFESRLQAISEKKTQADFRQDGQDLADAVAELCLSGNESPLPRSDIYQNKAFRLAFDGGSPNAAVSLFNVEAFGLLSDILTYLHRKTKFEEGQDCDEHVCEMLRDKRERFECHFLEKLCQIVVAYRFDYEFVSASGVITRIIEELDGYSEMAQHTVLSVLSAIAIEARVIPYTELAAINAFIRKDTFRRRSIHALLAFGANLLRFDDAYHEIFRSVGLVSTLVTLFLDQTTTLCSDAASTQIRVEFPTRTVGGGEPNGTPHFVDESPIVSLLAAHCHQRARRRSPHRSTVGQTDFLTLVDIMKLLAGGVRGDAVTMDEQYFERTLCGLPMLESICTLIGNSSFQHEGLALWGSIIRVTLILQCSDEVLRNVVNSFLQAVRYVTLAVYFPQDGQVTVAFPGNLVVLQGALAYLEALLRPKDASVANSMQHEKQDFTLREASERNRFLGALLDCDVILSLLGTLCAVAKKWEADTDSTNHSDDNNAGTLMMLSLQSLFSLVTSSTEAGRLFVSSISFGNFGDLIGNLLAHYNDMTKARKGSKITTDDSALETDTLVVFCVRYCIGFSLGDYEMACLGGTFSSAPTLLKDGGYSAVLRYPNLFAVAIQLLSIWAGELDADSVLQLMNLLLRISAFPGNSSRLASANVLEIILRSFTATARGPKEPLEPNESMLSQALLWENNVFHELAVSLVENVALAGVSPSAANYWVKMLVSLFRDRSKQLRAQNSMGYRTGIESKPTELKKASATPVPTLLRLLLKLTSATFDRTQGAPAIEFDISKEGFGCLQIPDVNARSSSSSDSGSPAPSLSTFSHNSKVWPPPEGYSVMVWFRVDSYERKEEREKLYRECFMSNSCIHCRGKVQDEYVLKCSHRACRGCIEALLNSGGECVVCNPPIFYLFRFRSSDGKSVSEAFLKGGKLFMRTSSNRASVYQFSHTPIKTKQWHQVVFTHTKQRFQSSMVSCYLNGILQENVKIPYPSSTTGSQPLSGLIGVPSQARRCSTTKWTLGPFYLLDLPISAPVVNAVFAAGPSYDRLFFGAAGNNEIGVTFDHLNIANMEMLDLYMWDPVRSLIDSVDVERTGRNKLLRRSLSLASAASSTAAALVQDIKSSANVFSRIPSAVPLIHVPVPSERILVAYSARNGVTNDLQIVLSSKLDGRPSGHLMGGTVLREAATMASTIFDISSSGCQIAYVLLDEASTEEEVELALNLLGLLMQNNSRNLTAMENDHGYGIVNYLLHKKASLLSTNSLQIIFRIVGVRIELENPARQLETTTHASSDSAIRNVQALQYFILDYSLWQKAPEVNISKLLFSTLYSCLAADDEAIRERNRAQLQSISFIRQLLYVLLDPTVTADLLRVIVDVILVCLTSSNREATVESNFADVTSFLTSTVSPRLGHYKEEVAGEEMLADDGWSVHRDTVDGGRLDPIDTELMKAHTLASPTARLCLSPRGSQRMIGNCWDAQKISKLNPGPTNWVNARLISHQSKIQDLLFETLLKAVQKLEIKEARDHGNDLDNSVADSGASNASRSVATSNGGTSRMQLPSATRLTGFRKYLGLRWIEYFLFPGDETEFSVGIAPSTVIAALNLLGTLLGNSRYEIVFKKEGYYRLLAQGLPCNHSLFSNLAVDSDEVSFPFEKLWYALFSALLGPPIDGTPHEIRLELEYLGKDFEVNIQRDRIVNSSILLVIMILLRRHFNDPVTMVSIIGGISTEELTFPGIKTKQEGGNRSTTATTSFLDQSGIYHLEVLDFLQHIFERMPSLHTLFLSGNEKLRLEFMEELTRLICAAARACLLAQYPYSQEHIIQVLQDKQVAVTEYNVAIGRAELAEEAAAADASGNDPFLHHTVAARGLRLLIALLMKVLLDAPNGHDLVEEYVVGTATSSVVLPPLHNGLILRFQSLVVMGLLDHIRVKFDDDDILVKHKYFGENVREFVRFVVEKMHSWQRAQHGDGCPPAFACCGRAHFLGGPSRLLELVLYVLSETNVGPAGIDGGGPSSLAAPSPSSLGSMLTDKLSKGKKRRPFRQLMDRMNISRSADGDNLQSELYTALNAVILHVLHGRAAEVSDEELEAMLQQVHLHREVVFGLQNQDTTFFSCLCRYLLQLVSDSASSSLQDAAAHLWIDLMMFRRAFIAELLTVEIRKTGAPPYSVNLMKNGFDVLLGCSKTQNNPPERGIVQSPDFIKFLKWLELVGPLLKELESSLDRLYISTVLETKESVHEVWAAYHKKASHRKAKYEKQFDARYDWFVLMETQYVESLLRAQQIEFRRQLKWKQDRVDRQKFIVRQWGHIQQDFQRNTLGSSENNTEEEKVGEVVSATTYDPVLMLEIANKSNYVVVLRSHQQYSWRLDFTEGPYRMRKRLSRMILSSEMLDQPSSSNGVTAIKTRSRHKCDLNAIARRRYSDSDVEVRGSGCRESPTYVMVKHRITRQKSDERSMEGKKQLPATKSVLASSASTSAVLSATERLHKGSFEALFNKYVKSDRRASRHESFRFSRLSARRESFVDHDERTDDAEENASGIDIVESSNISEVTAGSGNVALEENVDEKLRPLLMPGDEITDIYDCLRIDGMDSCPGVFLLCNDHLYIIDNYQRLSQRTAPGGIGSDYGEQNAQIRVTEVPQGSTTLLERRLSWRLQKPSQQTQTRIPRSKDIHQCRYWGYDDITELHKRRYQLRHVALEIFANDGRNYLVTLETPEQRELVFHALLNKCPNVQGAASGLDGVAGRGDLYSHLRKLLRNNMTERWVQGDISNFAYLMHLNTLAGRSYNDLTQYPVFPWILSDYDSEVLDVNDPGVYRDLSKPMGALRREEEFRARYEGLLESAVEAGDDEEVDHPLSSRPFHYGTHYSSAAITLHYLMRLEPFTSHFRRLHGGKFDHADRLFTSIGGAWKSAAGFEGAQNGTQDVKELIPEFFYLPEFLENVNECAFGTSQTGIVVGDVELPPWANGSPSEFVRLNRAALESPFVSANLHNWIDLIFGYKQQGPEAVEACNVFYHLTYEGSVDLDAITDPSTKRAILDQITEFGQTPSQLFRTAHPVRATAASVNSTTSTNSSLFASSVGPLSSANNAHNGPTESGASTSTIANSSRIATSPVTARAALANSFLEGGELITRMQTILSNGPGLSGTFVGTTEATPSPVLENSALLQKEPRRQVPVNPLLAFYRRGHQLSSMTSGNSSSVQHIAWTSGSVGRDEKVVTTGPRCLLIPPRNNEYLAWGFQDRSVKVISTGSAEIGGHGSDSKVVACLELEVEIDVAAITTDGRIVVTSSPGLPVLRVWRFNSTRRSLAASIAAASGSSSVSATSSSASAVATSLAAASSLSAPHRRRTYTTMGSSSTRSLTMIGSIGSPAHHQRITALQASRAYSVLVSGCAGGVAVLWDLNRRRFIRQLPPISSVTSGNAKSISAICINEVTGDIVVAAGATFGVFNVNGAVGVRLDDSVVVFQDPTALSPAYITSLAVNRGEACEWSSEKHVVTGHADGTLCVWAYSQAGGRNQNTRSRRKDDWVIELQGRHKVTPRSAITAVCVTPDKRKLYTGTHDGQLSVWTAALPNSSP